MRNAVVSSLFILALCGPAGAQQRPHYTQYILNNYILNPAITGIENYMDVKLSVRNQWVGIDGAPTTHYATIHAPLGKKDYTTNATSFGMKGENPRGRQYWLDYQAAPAHHGIGVQMMNYRTGYINRFSGTVTYAYHLPLGIRTTLAAGFGAGILNVSVDRSKIELANPIDPAIGQGTSEIRMLKPDLNAGLWLYGPNYFVGVSAQQIIPTRVSLVDNALYRSTLVPHLLTTAGYRFQLSEDISLLPSAMARYIPSMPVFVDVNLKAQYRDLLWVGGNARITEGFSAMAGINVSNTFNVSYSYDISRTRYMLGMMQRGTHEVVIGFLLNNAYGDTCPRNVW
jgi:type IX secretion system PorP/SprF family membrane protein